jgi:ATP-dependent Lhr-like helicase
MVSTAPPSKATFTWVTLFEPIDAVAPLPEPFERWFGSRGWSPRAHQLELLAKARAGRSVLLIAPTGAGKTLAGFLPSLVELSTPAPRPGPAHRRLISTGRDLRSEGGLHTLYISPLKALAVDIARNLETPVAEMKLPIRVETRTGDTPASKRQRQRRDPPQILLTTPEQLALILASPDAPFLFGTLRRVVLDELHALVTSKRGDLLSLGLARLFRLAPELTSVASPPPWRSLTICGASWCHSHTARRRLPISLSRRAALRLM